MADVSDLEAQRLASAFRPHRKPLWITVFANLTMAVLLLGVPYWRGRSLGAAQRRNFAGFARCLFGGQIAATPGLSLPRGEREHFAAQVMFAKPAWPTKCSPALRKLAPEEAIFLWPSVKQAGADMRAAVALVERELSQLDAQRKRGPSRVPERPLAAFKRLQAATVLYARAAGADADIDNDAIRFDQAIVGLAIPARLPLLAGQNATLEMWSSGLALEALALDTRGLSYLRVAEGKIDRQRLRRTSFLRGVVRAAETPYLVWAMPEARCREREDHCAGRPTGLTPYDRDDEVLPEPVWKLAGHPAGRIDRALLMTATGRVDLLARANAEGGLELRRFRLPDQAAPGTTPTPHEAQLIDASERWPVTAQTGALSATLLTGEPGAVLFATQVESNINATLLWANDAHTAVQLPAASGTGAWALACTAGDNRYLAYGSTSQLRLARVDLAQGAQELLVHDVSLLKPLHDDNPAFDQVHLMCDATGARVLFDTEQHELLHVGCRAESCQPVRKVASEVAGYAAVLDGEQLAVAWSGMVQAAVVQVVRLDASGAARSASVAPAACWEPLGGMCGTPSLLRDGQRLLLTARDGADLLALESSDHGQTFATLSGFVVDRTFEPSTTSPLQQHRLRKGLE